MTEVYKKIVALLESKGVEFEQEHHEAVTTSEAASQVRGVSMHAGAKALVMRGEKTKTHWLFIMPADLRGDTKKMKEIVGERVSFAPKPEEVTGCVKGSVPPFGSVLGLKTYCDPKLAENEIIHFNAGSLTDSVSMRYTDYLAVEQPTIIAITE